MSAFNQRQLELIEKGKQETARLKEVAKLALGIRKNTVTVKRHTYIYSLPGAGKTHTVAQTAIESGTEVLQIHGSTSIPAFARMLAFALHNKEPKDTLTVWIDDCDDLFMSEASLNVMKGMLDESRGVLEWNKSISGQIERDLKSENENTRKIGEAMKAFQPAGSPGISIPIGDTRFIITSNKELCAPTRIREAGKPVSKRRMHEGALRDRINYHDFEMRPYQSWGWCASILLDPECDIGFPLAETEKYELLQFMYSNWDQLPSTSMRAVKDLSAKMKNHPSDYAEQWKVGLLR